MLIDGIYIYTLINICTLVLHYYPNTTGMTRLTMPISTLVFLFQSPKTRGNTNHSYLYYEQHLRIQISGVKILRKWRKPVTSSMEIRAGFDVICVSSMNATGMRLDSYKNIYMANFAYRLQQCLQNFIC